jgi:hypothetical protein
MLTQAYKQGRNPEFPKAWKFGCVPEFHGTRTPKMVSSVKCAIMSGNHRGHCGVRVLLMLKLIRDKRVVPLLSAAFLFLLLGTNTAFAKQHTSDRHLSYHTRLDHDLDGDQIPETATVRQRGYVYQVNIHFTTGSPKLHLTTYLTEAGAGLTFQTTDVNNDRKNDLVITTATSLRPLAIWLNQGKSKFKKISSWSYLVGGYTGPKYNRKSCQPDPVGNLSIEPLPQATLSATYFDIADDVAGLPSSQAERLPFASRLRQVSPRGPPATTRI